MKAFVLAGGLGTRLRPRFGELPKALAPVGGRPFLALQLEHLAAAGVREAILCTGFGAGAIRQSLGDGAGLGIRLRYSEEPEPLGTGGALQLAAPLVNGPCLVANGDTLAPCDPWALERARWECGALGAVALFRVADPASRGRVDARGDGMVERFVEKDGSGTGPAWVNGGLYALAPEAWRRMPAPEPGRCAAVFSLERELLPALAAEGRLAALRVDGEFYDIGTPEDWERATRRFGA
ncbi:MAG TPA: sugar phosphate nucleotidyltransferase [Terriglobales bacterium]|nr:sugar phosphate nucleotidyltransferase [Terriglobales bacterium]